jgi:hypothetical protein
VDRFWENINHSQAHECENWDWGRAMPIKGIHKWDFRCSGIDLSLEAGSCVKLLYIFTKLHENHSETEKGFLKNCKIGNFGFQPYKLYKKRIFCKSEKLII